MDTTSKFVEINPDVLGGTPVFVQTRVPVKTLLDYLSGGSTVEEFLDHFPTVKREQAVGVLNQAGQLLVANAHSA